jgi:hypothetical protein
MGVSAGPDVIDTGLVLALDAADTISYPGSGIHVYNLFPKRVALSTSIGSGDTFNYISETTGISTVGTSEVNGERDNTNYNCSGAVTFAEALAFAHGLGARLPTRQEVIDGAGSGTGCGYDALQVWTCDKSDTDGNSHYTVYGNTNAYGTTATSTLNTSTAYVTYVTDIDLNRSDPVSLTDPVMASILRGHIENGRLINGVGTTTDNGGCFVFDGTNDYIDVITEFDYDNIGKLEAVSGNTWSTFVWFRPITTGSNAESFVIGKGGGAGASTTFVVWVNENSEQLFARLKGGTTLTISSVNNNQWYNVGVTWDGTTAKAYLNGSFVNNISVGGASYQVELFNLGTTGSGGGGKFTGNIAASTVYNRALTAEEIQQNFNALRGRFSI